MAPFVESAFSPLKEFTIASSIPLWGISCISYVQLTDVPLPGADFSGENVVERHMERLGRDALLSSIREAADFHSKTDLDVVLKEYGAMRGLLTAGSVLQNDLGCRKTI